MLNFLPLNAPIHQENIKVSLDLLAQFKQVVQDLREIGIPLEPSPKPTIANLLILIDNHLAPNFIDKGQPTALDKIIMHILKAQLIHEFSVEQFKCLMDAKEPDINQNFINKSMILEPFICQTINQDIQAIINTYAVPPRDRSNRAGDIQALQKLLVNNDLIPGIKKLPVLAHIAKHMQTGYLNRSQLRELIYKAFHKNLVFALKSYQEAHQKFIKDIDLQAKISTCIRGILQQYRVPIFDKHHRQHDVNQLRASIRDAINILAQEFIHIYNRSYQSISYNIAAIVQSLAGSDATPEQIQTLLHQAGDNGDVEEQKGDGIVITIKDEQEKDLLEIKRDSPSPR